MAYSPDMPAASRRHCDAADALADGPRFDVAGYLYGISAECAVKAMMLTAGIRPLSADQRRSDPFYAHFPELRTMLKDTLHGRQGAVLRRFIEKDSFLRQWNTQMRYCKGSEIDKQWVDAWRDQAHQIVSSIDT